MSYQPEPQRPCISFDEIQQSVTAKQMERDERIVSKWLEILTLDYVKDKISEAIYEGKSEVVLISMDIGSGGINYGALVNRPVGRYTESVKDVIHHYVSKDEKYGVYYRPTSNGKVFEIGVSWFDFQGVVLEILSVPICCVFACCACCLLCSK